MLINISVIGRNMAPQSCYPNAWNPCMLMHVTLHGKGDLADEIKYPDME